MKTKLLKRLRNRGRNKVEVYSISKTSRTFSDGYYVSGVSYGYSGDEYSEIWKGCSDPENEIPEKAARIYIETNMESIRKKYKKFSRKYKNNKYKKNGH